MTGQERLIADLELLRDEVKTWKFHQDIPNAKSKKGILAFREELYKINQCAVNWIYDTP